MKKRLRFKGNSGFIFNSIPRHSTISGIKTKALFLTYSLLIIFLMLVSSVSSTRVCADEFYDYFQSAIKAQKSGDFKEAVRLYERSIKHYDSSGRPQKYLTSAYYHRGLAKQMLGNNKEAIKDYTKAIEIDPENYKSYHNRAIVKDFLGNYKEAIEDYTKAIKINPDFSNSYQNRGADKLELGNYEEAIKDFTQAIEINPQYALAYYNRGKVKTDLGNYKEAIKDHTKAIEINPGYARAYHNRGINKAILGNYEEAIRDFTQAIAINPEDYESYHNRGLARANLGNHKEAIEDFTKSIKIQPEYTVAYGGRGFSYYALGKFERAIADYMKTTGSGLQGFGSQQKIERIICLFTIEQYDRALKLSKKYLTEMNWKGDFSSYIAMFGNFSARKLGETEKASTYLNRIENKNDTSWPEPIIDYLQGEITENKLSAQANGINAKTEAYTFIATDKWIKSNNQGIREKLKWIEENGNENRIEYHFSKHLLKKLND